ncbi:MAG: undecaprenyldiphospho-muramoylpentapeptide beta-N-acetylglucosaminyltransferase [Pirellulales bacterium]|nr:undecaprenyldiphospho-muramoylpentapeptide beta-N-acetylglucosaminyltransferase [Pirellulales bacterium]
MARDEDLNAETVPREPAPPADGRSEETMQTLLSMPFSSTRGVARSAHVVIAGGGTAGHLFPGLAVAERLRQMRPDVRITFAGAGRPAEKRHVAAAGFDYLALPCRPRPSSAWGTLRFVTDHWAGYRRALRFLRREQVGCVIGLGGYGSVPAARAAGQRGVPLVLLEQNAVPGRATRWLAQFATVICAALPQSKSEFWPAAPVRITGTPIREDFARAGVQRAAWLARRRQEGQLPTRRLLVLGGSQGARSLNQFVPRALYKAGAAAQGWRIVHQTGEEDVAETTRAYGKLAIRATVVPFIGSMADALRDVDLVISRAGGSTLAELAALGVPALLVPYPHAADDHQRANADVFVAAGAAQLIDARESGGRLDTRLAAALAPYLAHPERLDTLAAGMLSLARPDAAWHVAQMVDDLLPARQVRKAG